MDDPGAPIDPFEPDPVLEDPGDAAAPSDEPALGGEEFHIGGTDLFGDPVPVVDPNPADPATGPSTVTVGDPWGDPPTVIEAQPVPVSEPQGWTFSNPWGDPPIVIEGESVPASDPDVWTYRGPDLPISPDATDLTATRIGIETQQAVAAWEQLMPGAHVPDGSAYQIYEALMEQTADPAVRDWAFEKITELNAELSNQLQDGGQ